MPVLTEHQTEWLRLGAEERLLMQRAFAECGYFTIEGLADGEMLCAANNVVRLKNRGLVRTSIQFSREIVGQPVRVTVELTDRGRQILER